MKKNLIVSLLLFILIVINIKCKETQIIKNVPENAKTIPVFLFAENRETKNLQIKNAPEELQTRITSVFYKNKINPDYIKLSTFKKIFINNPASLTRANIIKDSFKHKKRFIFMLECSAAFYDFIVNQYKWNVFVKVSLIDTKKKTIKSEIISSAAFLKYKHLDAFDALINFDSNLEEKLNEFIKNNYEIILKEEKGNEDIIQLKWEDASNKNKDSEIGNTKE